MKAGNRVGRVGGSKPKVATPEVVNKIEALKREKHDMFAWEIREKLIESKFCHPSLCPSISSINRILRKRAAERAAEKTFSKERQFYAFQFPIKDRYTYQPLQSTEPYLGKKHTFYPRFYESQCIASAHHQQNDCTYCMSCRLPKLKVCAPPLLPIADFRNYTKNEPQKLQGIK